MPRNADKLAAIAADLAVRNPRAEIAVVVSELIDPSTIQTLVAQIVADSAVDSVLIAQGTLPDQAMCQQELVACADALVINAVSPVLFTEAFAEYFAARKAGTLALIGSVAGDRGRKSNYIYGAAKGLLTRYAEGLQHRFAGSGIHVVLINPGPTDTPMTAAFKQQGMRLAAPERVASQIVKAMRQGKPVAYIPGYWRWIMTVISLLPRVVFNRLNI